MQKERYCMVADNGSVHLPSLIDNNRHGSPVALDGAFAFGDDVQIVGSTSRPELNGIYGKIVSRLQDDEGRWEVQIIGKKSCIKKFHNSLLKKSLPVQTPQCIPACVAPTNCIVDSFAIFFNQTGRLLPESGIHLPTGLSSFWEDLFLKRHANNPEKSVADVVDVQAFGSRISSSSSSSERVGKYWVPRPLDSNASSSTCDINLKSEDELHSPVASGVAASAELSADTSGNTYIPSNKGGSAELRAIPGRREYPSIPSNPDYVREYKISDTSYVARDCIQQAIDFGCCRTNSDGTLVCQSSPGVPWNLFPASTRIGLLLK